MKGREIFKVEGDKITRLRRHCPKCGDGFFLAVHKNRISCGKCGYTEFKSGKTKKSEPTDIDKKSNIEIESKIKED
jgi:small subunit ribosomal protein S27Ae